MKRFLCSLVLAGLLSSCGGDPEPAEGAKKKIVGEVTLVSYVNDLIWIDVGEKDGVKPRSMFTVVRDGEIIGVVSVEAVESDSSACREIRNRRKKVIEKGDVVTQE